jgi:hypothetical protein
VSADRRARAGSSTPPIAPTSDSPADTAIATVKPSVNACADA